MKINIEDAYKTLESYLSNNKYLVGNTMTVADISALSTISSIDGLHPIDEKRYDFLILIDFTNFKKVFHHLSDHHRIIRSEYHANIF